MPLDQYKVYIESVFERSVLTGRVKISTTENTPNSVDSKRFRVALTKGPNWKQSTPPPSPEDGNRSSFRNVVFTRIPDDGKSPKPSNSVHQIQVSRSLSIKFVFSLK
jgi:hypothetical protein